MKDIGNYKTESIGNLDLIEVLKNTDLYPKMYIRKRDCSREFAAIGQIHTSTDLSSLKLEKEHRYFGGFGFDPKRTWNSFPHHFFFLPLIEICQDKNETILKYEGKYPQFHSKESPILGNKVLTRSDFPDQKKWNRNIEHTLKKILYGKMKKVVLARRTNLQLENAVCPFSILQKMKVFSNSTLFLIQMDADNTFLGASPEKLLLRTSNQVQTEALAGTYFSKEGPLSKESLEFSYVDSYLEQNLKRFCKNVLSSERSVCRAHSFFHLYRSFQGEYLSNATDSQFLSFFHPTPALLGTPKKESYSYLREIEPFARGWFGGGIGFLSKEESDISVGIRSGWIRKNQVALFAGAGIVDGSNPQKEWDELEAKISPFLKVLT